MTVPGAINIAVIALALLAAIKNRIFSRVLRGHPLPANKMLRYDTTRHTTPETAPRDFDLHSHGTPNTYSST